MKMTSSLSLSSFGRHVALFGFGVLVATASSPELAAAPATLCFVSDFNMGMISEIGVDGSISTFTSSAPWAYGMAFDSSGNLYVSDWVDNYISKITPSGATSSFATGFSAPGGMAFDGAGNLYVVDETGNSISKVSPAGVVTPFASGFDSPYSLAFDQSGNLFVPNFGNGTVAKVTTNGVVTTFATGFNKPYGVAFDGTGNLYVSDAFANTVSKITPAGVVSTFATGFDGPAGLLFDSAGNLYVANHISGTISQVSPSGAVTTFATGLSGPIFMAAPMSTPTGTAPVISVPPASQSGTFGGTVTFSVTATGTAPLSYQWYVNQQPVPGGTNATLTVSGLDGTQSGAYDVFVQNDYGAVDSAAADLYFLGVTPSSSSTGRPVTLTLGFTPGSRFQVQYNTNLTNPGGWTTMTNLLLATNEISFIDPGSVASPARFYRAFHLLTP